MTLKTIERFGHISLSGLEPPLMFQAIPSPLFEEIKLYLDDKSYTAFKTTNIFLYLILDRRIFQFKAKDLDAAFKDYLLIRPREYLAFDEGKFRIKNFNAIQRFARRCFGCYKETHLKNVENGCSLIAARSKLNVRSYRDRAFLKKIGEKILSKKTASPPSACLYQNLSTFTTIQNELTVFFEEEDLVGSLDVAYSRAYGISTNFGIKVRFALNTKEYVHFIVMDPAYSEKEKSSIYMELGSVCKVHAADGSFLEYNHPKFLPLCTAVYKIAQSIAVKAHVDIRVPVRADPHISEILTERGFELVNCRLYPHWKWTCTALDNLPNVKINLEFNW